MREQQIPGSFLSAHQEPEYEASPSFVQLNNCPLVNWCYTVSVCSCFCSEENDRKLAVWCHMQAVNSNTYTTRCLCKVHFVETASLVARLLTRFLATQHTTSPLTQQDSCLCPWVEQRNQAGLGLGLGFMCMNYHLEFIMVSVSLAYKHIFGVKCWFVKMRLLPRFLAYSIHYSQILLHISTRMTVIVCNFHNCLGLPTMHCQGVGQERIRTGDQSKSV